MALPVGKVPARAIANYDLFIHNHSETNFSSTKIYLLCEISTISDNNGAYWMLLVLYYCKFTCRLVVGGWDVGIGTIIM